MDTYWETAFSIMKNEIRFLTAGLFLISVLMSACSEEQSARQQHYFLKGYDELEFRTTDGVKVHPDQFIQARQRNGHRFYEVVDTSLTLVHKITDEPYDGYIRTFHRDRYNLNLQGEFENGKMFRLRYWHPNRTLGMDADLRDSTLSVWTSAGKIGIEANADEIYYYYPGQNAIKEIISDTMRSYFDTEGNLEHYSIYTDTASIHYYANGQKRAFYPFTQNVGLHGMVKEWYPNGQLKVKGRYENRKQVGTWTKYDSLGNVEERIEY
mgnify:CR=1 FL=1